MKYCFDASVLIDMWNDFYPMTIFPTLYEKLRKIVQEIIIIKPIFDQISEEKQLCSYLKEIDLQITPIKNKHQEEALSLETKYQTIPDSKGADPTDIKLISFAKIEKHFIVTSESKQTNQPGEIKNYKIPRICDIEKVGCINFIEFLGRHHIEI